ncbi:hypothetical protein SAMN05216413_0333 [Ruminococcaceae bacterium KH2T8]|nr:hypothetical protein SAMN05216413_0333 [Ruminococcaceae bacterium KH2T8]
MVDEGRLFSGDRRYMSCVERYGREDILEQVREHLVLEAQPSSGWKAVYITEKYLICLNSFVLAFDDLELFDLTKTLRKDRLTILAFDRFGNMFKDQVFFSENEFGKIRYEIASRTPGLLLGNTPDNQLEYKRRHTEDFARNAKVFMSQTKMYRYQKNFLYRDRGIVITIIMVVFLLLTIARLFTAETASQWVAGGFIVLFFGALIFFMIRYRKKVFGSYKSFVKEHEDEILDQINSKVVFTPNTSNKRAVFVTEKYLVLIGEAVWNREDVIEFHRYLYKGNMHFQATDKNGETRSTSVVTENRDWDFDELVIGSLLPNAVVGDTTENREYVNRFKK